MTALELCSIYQQAQQLEANIDHAMKTLRVEDYEPMHQSIEMMRIHARQFQQKMIAHSEQVVLSNSGNAGRSPARLPLCVTEGQGSTPNKFDLLRVVING